MHGCTFGGGPLVTAAGACVLERGEHARDSWPGCAAAAAMPGSRPQRPVAAAPVAREARGPRAAARDRSRRGTRRTTPPALVRAARDQGLLLVRGGERAVRLLPPLTVTTEEIAEAIERLDRAVTRLESTASGEPK